MGFLILFLNAEAFQFSLLSMVLTVGVSYMVFIMLKKSLSIPSLQSICLGWLNSFDRGSYNGHTTTIVNIIHVFRIIYLKTVKMENFMLHIFYNSKNNNAVYKKLNFAL